jgi:hypothetical protein
LSCKEAGYPEKQQKKNQKREVQTKQAKAVPDGAAFCVGLTIGGHLHIINATKKETEPL